MRQWKQLVGFLLVLQVSALIGQINEKQPNVILFLVDDLGWTDLSSYGSYLYQTPNVDQLAQSGVKFTDAYAACTVCSPTRASILTGKYPARVNCTDWIKGHEKPYAPLKVPDWTQHIRDEDTTIAEVLKNRGYTTIHIGKWHLGEEETNLPKYHGFDTNIGGWKVGQPNKVNKVGGYFSPYNNPRLKDGPDGEYLTERLAQDASNFIETNKDKPFFMNYWLYNVHTPLEAKQEKIRKYEGLIRPDSLQSNATYAAMVEHMDDALGVVISSLKNAGIYENTILIFASDNGGLIGTNGDLNMKPKVTSNYPLRSGKGDMYEGGVRTPFMISWPEKIKGGRNSDVLAISADIFPTVLGLIGANDALPSNVDGQDLSNLLLSNIKPDREALFWHYPHYHTEGATPYSAVRKGEWKLIQIYGQDRLELYNLKTDLGETNNLIEANPDKAKELLALLSDWKRSISAQEPTVNPDYDPEKANKWGKK